jgi:hypothetical protein
MPSKLPGTPPVPPDGPSLGEPRLPTSPVPVDPPVHPTPPVHPPIDPRPPIDPGPGGGDPPPVATTASITSWTQLIPQCRDADMAGSVSARIHDPLWMLTRQWQVGEYQGEDAGTPIVARVRASNAPFTRIHLGAIPPNTILAGDAYDPLAAPLETIVERRAMRPASITDAAMLSFTVEAGLQFLRMLDAQRPSQSYRSNFIAKFALPAVAVSPDDDAASRFARLAAGRALDARQLAAALRSTSAAQLAADPSLGVASGDRAEVAQAAGAWLSWYDIMFSEPTGTQDAWDPSRMEYSVTISAQLSANPFDQFNFTAGEIDDGRLDWASFDFNGEINMGTGNDRDFRDIVETTIPAPVTFRGGPAPRFWEMEDAKLAYGLLPVGPTDLVQLMMIEYASSYGNDWFVVPLDLPVGSITQVNSLVVTDTFGVKTLLQAIGTNVNVPANFTMWTPAFMKDLGSPLPGPRSNCFFLPPTLGSVLDGATLEDVAFMRDEMANLAWAIERSVQGATEQPVRRSNGGAAANTTTTSGGSLPRYLLSTTVPDNWIPLLPVELKTASGAVQSRLKRGAVLQPDGSAKIHPAEGKILNAGASLLIYDEEVPREGMHITSSRRTARWVDGATVVWTGYRRSIGRGEGSSGLQFDEVVEPFTAP